MNRNYCWRSGRKSPSIWLWSFLNSTKTEALAVETPAQDDIEPSTHGLVELIILIYLLQ